MFMLCLKCHRGPTLQSNLIMFLEVSSIEHILILNDDIALQRWSPIGLESKKIIPSFVSSVRDHLITISYNQRL